MLLRWIPVFTILCFHMPFIAKGIPVHQENVLLDSAESNQVLTEVQSPNDNIVIGKVVKESNKNIERDQKSVDEEREGKQINIRDLLLDDTFGSVDFSNAVLSADGTKECINKTQFVETVVSDR